jgi:hypothetical protein
MPPDARILEKQNSLRMSQIFSCIHTIVNWWFCFFKDSPSGTAELKGTEFQDQLYTYARIKTQTRCGAHGGFARPFNFYKFRSHNSEAASPRRRCSQPDLDTPTPRRSEARLRWPYCNNIQDRPRLFVLFHRPTDALEKDIRRHSGIKIGRIRGSNPLGFKSLIESNL